uniref:Uncharacterized protein n=1 Tax=Xanthomonas arboricola pv. pruni str. CFBP 5530 TaxID=1045865 RepID=G4U4Q9_9XANT|nr:hypothetical protein XAP_pXAP410024 [Xanthomonas arboricola pv. pruni str. CFBP 5530]
MTEISAVPAYNPTTPLPSETYKRLVALSFNG